jgi:hypothetical protein
MKAGKVAVPRSTAASSRRSTGAGKGAAPASQAVEAPAAASDSRTALTAEERYTLVARAAYLRAEARGFEPGHALDDWLAAEAELVEQLARG